MEIPASSCFGGLQQPSTFIDVLVFVSFVILGTEGALCLSLNCWLKPKLESEAHEALHSLDP